MKRLLYILAGLSLMFQGCSSDDSYVASFNRLNVSPGRIVIDNVGGEQTVFVIADGTWEVDCEEEWLEVLPEGNRIIISAPANGTPESLSATITVRLNGSDEHSATIRVLQPGNVTVNLSERGNANCYMVSTGTECRFDVSVKGNGSPRDGFSEYLTYYSIDTEGAVYSDILWEAVFDGDKTGSTRVIDGYSYYRDGYVYFKAGDREGNAVIALKDERGKVLWTWHIWVTDREVSQSEANGYRWMDRNLGALNNTPGDIANRGLMYQWGRKDAFLPSMAAYDYVGSVNAVGLNVDNMQAGNGTQPWAYNTMKATYTGAYPGNIPISVLYPMSFFMSTDKMNDWFMPSPEDDYSEYSALWGAAGNAGKTIFDPCPAGYMIPPAEAWGGGNDTDWGATVSNGKYWEGGSGDYFPMAGYREASNGTLMFCGARGYYWSRTTVDETFGAMALDVFNDEVSLVEVASRAVGGAVRCISEE